MDLLWQGQPIEVWMAHLQEHHWPVRIGQSNLMLSCPIRGNHPQGDRNPSFSFDPAKNVGHCFACGSVVDGAELWTMTGGGIPPIVPLTDHTVRSPYTPHWPGLLQPAHHQWLLDQGFTDTVIQAARLGSGPKGLGIPWGSRTGSLLWVNWRTFGSPKYLADAGALKRKSLYGWSLVPRTAIFLCLVEAELDALWCLQAGIPAVAMGGLELTSEQTAQLRLQGCPVLLLLDGDAAGSAKGPKLQQQLGDVARGGTLLAGNPRSHPPEKLHQWVDALLK